MPQTVMVISHRRSGTHWTLDTIRHNFDAVRDEFYTLDGLYRLYYLNRPQTPEMSELDDFLAQSNKITLIKTHQEPEFVVLQEQVERKAYITDLFQRSKKIYVYRDGRDVMVSAYHYTQKFATSPEIYGPEFQQFLRMDYNPDQAPALYGINRVDWWVRHVSGWLAEDVLPISYEDLTHHYAASIQRIAEYLDLPTPKKITEVHLKNQASQSQNPLNKLQQIFQKTNAGESSAVIGRKGITGDWKNHFSDNDLEFFMAKAGDLMRELGYI